MDKVSFDVAEPIRESLLALQIISPPETYNALVNARLPFIEIAFGIDGFYPILYCSLYDFIWI